MYNENNIQTNGWPRISVFAANAVYFAAAVGLVFVRFASGSLYAALQLLFPAISHECAVLVIYALYYGFFLGMPAMLTSGGRVGDCMRFRKFPFWKGVLIVLAALVGVVVTSHLASFWALLLQKAGPNPFATQTKLGATSPAGLLLCLISTAVLPAVFEELSFRGTVLPAYEGRGGRTRAVLISALLFTSLHASFVGLPTQLLLGVVMGCIVVATGSVWAGVLYHGVHNGVITVISYFQENAASAQNAQDTGDLMAYFGGVQGIAAYAVITALFFAIYLALLLPIFRKKHRAERLQAAMPRTRMTGAELLVLSAGFVTVIAFYAEDLLRMMGILR